jgi:hypothetical protein
MLYQRHIVSTNGLGFDLLEGSTFGRKLGRSHFGD